MYYLLRAAAAFFHHFHLYYLHIVLDNPDILSSTEIFFPLYSDSFAVKLFLLTFSSPCKTALIFQNSLGIKAFISFSLSHIIFNAADWTLPALKPLLTLRQRSGLI